MKAFSRSKSSNEKTYLEEKGTYLHVVGPVSLGNIFYFLVRTSIDSSIQQGLHK
jgi:hypothetical protein